MVLSSGKAMPQEPMPVTKSKEAKDPPPAILDSVRLLHLSSVVALMGSLQLCRQGLALYAVVLCSACACSLPGGGVPHTKASVSGDLFRRCRYV